MQRFAFFFLGALIVTLGADTPSPVRPADGTYVYTLAGVPALTTSTVVIRTNGANVSTFENVTVAGAPAVAETDYNTATLLPTHYRVRVGSRTTDVSFVGTSATLVDPPVTFHSNAGADPFAVGDGLIAYVAMMPSVLAAHAGTAISVLGLNGGKVITVNATTPDQARPPGVAATDIPYAATEAASGLRFSFWSNPTTHAVDAIDLGALKIRLASRTDSTVAATPQPAGAIATPFPMASPLYTDRNVTFASTAATLAGTISTPDGLGRARGPAFVFVHGSGAATRNGGTPENPTFLLLANALANQGYVVLRYDKRGIGKSTGVGTESWRPLADDASAAVAFLRTQPNVDPKRIFLVGHSEGGLIVSLVAPSIRPALAGIVLMAGPAISMTKILAEQAPRMSPQMRKATTAAFADYVGIEPSKVIAKVDVPILILQGSRDGQSLAKDLPPMLAAAHAAKRNVTAIVLAGDNHLFMVLKPDQVEDFSEYEIAAPLDPRVPRAILHWARLIP
ncbi:MAG: alpha/beta fold hydrolase [Candidatus Eremiobacteraeota bacterium]|nr:alpha/beta fold hydrolase [Candidatus Eremiobacteraeota bacterium]